MTLFEYCAKVIPVQRQSADYVNRIYSFAKSVDPAEAVKAVKLLGALAAKLNMSVTAENFRDVAAAARGSQCSAEDIWQVQIAERPPVDGIGRCWQTNLERDLNTAFLHALVFAFELAGVKSLEEVRVLEDMYG